MPVSDFPEYDSSDSRISFPRFWSVSKRSFSRQDCSSLLAHWTPYGAPKPPRWWFMETRCSHHACSLCLTKRDNLKEIKANFGYIDQVQRMDVVKLVIGRGIEGRLEMHLSLPEKGGLSEPSSHRRDSSQRKWPREINHAWLLSCTSERNDLLILMHFETTECFTSVTRAHSSSFLNAFCCCFPSSAIGGPEENLKLQIALSQCTWLTGRSLFQNNSNSVLAPSIEERSCCRKLAIAEWGGAM